MCLYKHTKNTNFSNRYNLIFIVGDEFEGTLMHQVVLPHPSINHRTAGIDHHFSSSGNDALCEGRCDSVL